MTHAHPEYSLPPELVKDGLRIVALGGLGEIGRNMTVFECNGKQKLTVEEMKEILIQQSKDNIEDFKKL